MTTDHNPLLLEQQLCFSLYSTSLAMTQVYKGYLAPLGLTYPQYLVLLILWEEDGIGLKTIASRLGQQSGALTPVIKRMEDEQLIRRERSRDDERALQIRLTEQGKVLRTRALEVNRCVFEQCGAPTQDLLALKDQLDRLRHSLNDSTI
ncbi:MAG: MarR family transcriptional regulator [Oceanospirillaceae bacterium]|nr:MarR family transcriptional regulator [Oceanospirillaceae bacterium]MBT12070.1 MarR family transcriptional regulator [Oceanospirillaceae bacterium]|tara:strand:+ start:31941 stop:32387 length:447 start_codon:yes stop_codon:yes gene_type:complete